MLDRVRIRIWAVCLGFAVIAGVAEAQQLSAPEIEMAINGYLEDGDPAAAQRLVGQQLDLVRDTRLRAALLQRFAELSEQAGDPLVAGEALAALADVLGQRAPPPGERAALFAKAGDLFARAGDADRALDAWKQGLEIAIATGQTELADSIAARLETLAGDRQSDDPLVNSFIAGAKKTPRVATKAGELAAGYRSQPAAASRSYGRRAIARHLDKGFAEVTVYYATDRAREDTDQPNEFYGGRRGDLEYGTARVTVPLSHQPGQIEAPSLFTFSVKEDPSRHIVLADVKPAADAAVFAAMRTHLDKTGSNEAFLFVHGFNVTFAEAAKRTAQMAYDMEFDGLPILFSWPSRGSALSYIADTAVVRLSGRRLARVLREVVDQSGAKRIHLIAHSMGNRAMTDALEIFALEHEGDEPVFDQVLFTAPDLDAGLFREMVATIRRVAARVTLYASNNDWALAVSRQLHGDAPRAGQGGEEILQAEDVDSVEMSALGEDMLAHSYFANNAAALTDILSLFWRDAPPERRCGMRQADGTDGSFWEYDPGLCDGDTMLAALRVLRRGSARTLQQARDLLREALGSEAMEEIGNERIEAALAKLYTR